MLYFYAPVHEVRFLNPYKRCSIDVIPALSDSAGPGSHQYCMGLHCQFSRIFVYFCGIFA